jgi:hypothetical protein
MVKIRTATNEDVLSLAHLMGELSDPPSAEDMRERYTYNYHTLVMESVGQVIGSIGLCTEYFYKNYGWMLYSDCKICG